MSAVKYWIWLSVQNSISLRSKAALIRHFGDAESAYHAPSGEFSKIENVSAKDAQILEKRDLSKMERIIGECARQNIRIITMQDADYPKRLKNIYSPPPVLYVKGELPQVDECPVISVIGTRSASAYGIKTGERLAQGIAACGATVLSLLTKGIDAAAAVGALRAGKPCIAVLGTAHERENGRLSRDVAAHGALISEYPPGTSTEKRFFRERNRIAAGLSVGVLVVEAPAHSGTMTFVEDASEQSKDIFAVPGNVDAENSVGTNALIKVGAKLVTDAWDVMSEYEFLYPDKVSNVSSKVAEGYASGEENPKNEDKNGSKVIDKQNDKDYIDWREKLAGLNETQLKIVAAVEKPSSHIDDIIAATGLSAMKVAQCITILKIKGVLRGEDGGRVALKIAEK